MRARIRVPHLKTLQPTATSHIDFDPKNIELLAVKKRKLHDLEEKKESGKKAF